MKRIIVVKFDNAPGGGTYVVANSVLEMLKNKFPEYERIIVYIEKNILYWEENGIKKNIANFKNIPPFLQPFFQCIHLRKHLSESDLILAFQGTVLFLPGKNIKLCYVHHSNAFRYFDDSKWKKFPFNLLNIIFAGIIFILEYLQRPDELFLNSRYTMLRCFHLRSKNKKKIIYPPVPLLKTEINETKQKYPVVSLGRIHPEKNHKLQLRLAKDFPDINFNIIGFCPPSEYSRWFVEEVKKYKNIETSFNLNDWEIEDKFSRAKYYLHTMKGEHFGIAIAQAAMQGCILIISEKGGSKEILPEKSLLYKNYSELKNIFSNLEELSKKLTPSNTNIESVRIKFSKTTFQEELYEIVKLYL